MTTDKERAEHMRKAAYHLEESGRNDAAGAWRRVADELDPPAPAYADGTIAWVTANTGKAILSQRINGRWDNYRHVTGATYASYVDSVVTKVESLRVLGDDEIAVKRTKADYFGADSDNWRIEANGVAYHHPAAADLCRSYADALDAEAGEQS